MKTIIIERPKQQPAADAPHEVLLRLQSEVDEVVAHANAQAEAEAPQRAAPAVGKAAEAPRETRVRFAHD